MIICYINGQPAYPATQSDIKITLQNPFIKDGDEKTMEVVFPMDIAQNAAVFKAINRLDTSFECEDYSDCRLVADNIEVIRGKGTITSITREEVKIQILAGKSYLKYKASFDNVFIDQIDYGTVAERYLRLLIGRGSSISQMNFVSELNSQGYIGEPGEYAFMPIHDEENDYWANSLCYLKNDDDREIGVTLIRAAVQPSLMFVMRHVIERLGYTVAYNAYDKSPWSDLYVASARVSMSLGGALPHWSCYKFLDEFRKLFNAVFLFDEVGHTVSIVPFGEAGGAGTEYITPVEGFSSGYDEEGLEYLEASNLAYELSDCERSVDVVSEDVKKGFTVVEYDTYQQLERAFQSMTVKQKLTTLMKLPVGWFYGRSIINDNGDTTGYEIAECGWFSQLTRKEGASVITLSMSPVGMTWGECRCFTAWAGDGVGGAFIVPVLELSFDCLIAHVACSKQVTDGFWIGKNNESEEYVTVEDVLEGGESVPEPGSDEELLELFFASGMKFKPLSHEFVTKYAEIDMSDPDTILQPVPFTECRHTDKVQLPRESLSLFPAADYVHIGNFHNKGIKIRRNVNGNNEVKIEFLYDGKPDPKKIYVISNRKFLCDRIEMGVSGEGISPMKTGYFYEIL